MYVFIFNYCQALRRSWEMFWRSCKVLDKSSKLLSVSRSVWNWWRVQWSGAAGCVCGIHSSMLVVSRWCSYSWHSSRRPLELRNCTPMDTPMLRRLRLLRRLPNRWRHRDSHPPITGFYSLQSLLWLDRESSLQNVLEITQIFLSSS